MADDASGASHFIGSVVLAPRPGLGPVGVQEWVVIDGQQRLTSLTILLAALRDHLATSGDESAIERINEQYLRNKWSKTGETLKLIPTRFDREEYRAIIERTAEAGNGEGTGAAYRFFRSQIIAADDPDDPHDIDRIEDAVTQRLTLVAITAGTDDNIHRIFESLNNTGLNLTQADLLRNYLFMRLPTTAEEAHSTYWIPMERQLGSDNLELLVWLDLVLRGHTKLRQDATYQAQQKRLSTIESEQELIDQLRVLARRAGYLARILRPDTDPRPGVRRVLENLQRWGSQTVYPIAMYLLERSDIGEGSAEEIVDGLTIVESYLVRRMIVGKATAGTNRTLTSLIAEMDPTLPPVAAIHRYLSEGRRWYPTDDQLRDEILSGNFYWRGRATQRTFVLQRLEQARLNNEPVDLAKLTIEHVMPQTLSDGWRNELMALLDEVTDIDEEHERLVHTLGNLTLSGYNSALSNRPYQEKRALLRDSGVRMNRDIALNDVWGPEQIERRSVELFELCCELWPGPLVVEGAGPDRSEFARRLSALLALLPRATWTSYRDVAAVLGSSAQAVGVAVSRTADIPNAHRVLRSDGRIADGFHWVDPGRTDDLPTVLVDEGIRFMADGTANPAQRMTAHDLAALAGIEVDDDAPGTEVSRWDEFVASMEARQPSEITSATLDFLTRWKAIDGLVAHGARSEEAGAILTAQPFGHTGYQLWIGAVYPTAGTLEIWFQHLKAKEPFSDPEARRRLLSRLNAIDGIDIPESKLSLRPSIPLSALTVENHREELVQILRWVVDHSIEALTAAP